jgi:cell shape-determining protein MreC
MQEEEVVQMIQAIRSSTFMLLSEVQRRMDRLEQKMDEVLETLSEIRVSLHQNAEAGINNQVNEQTNENHDI